MTIRERIDEARVQELLTVEQMALLTQLKEQTIYRKAKKGDIPGVVRLGRTLRFHRVVALRWAAKVTIPPPTDE